MAENRSIPHTFTAPELSDLVGALTGRADFLAQVIGQALPGQHDAVKNKAEIEKARIDALRDSLLMSLIDLEKEQTNG